MKGTLWTTKASDRTERIKWPKSKIKLSKKQLEKLEKEIEEMQKPYNTRLSEKTLFTILD